jgi:hypothetical protein
MCGIVALLTVGAKADIAVTNALEIADGLGGFPEGLLGTSDAFGVAVTTLGDAGMTMVGAYGDDDGCGAVYALSHHANLTVSAVQKIGNASGGFGGALDLGDLFGVSVSLVDVRPESERMLVAVGACRDDDGGPDRGAVWLLDLTADGVVVSESKISDTEGGFGGALSDGDTFGRSVCVLPVSGTEEMVLAVGAPGTDGGAGAVWLLWVKWTDLRVSRWLKITASSAGFPDGVLDERDLFGSSVASAGDVDGDGDGDLLVGAPGDDDGGFNSGAVYVLVLHAGTGTVKAVQKISATQGGLPLGALGYADMFGWSVASLDDADGDGTPDAIVGAPGDNDGGYYRGAARVLFLNSDGTVKGSDKISSTTSERLSVLLQNGDAFGMSVACIPSPLRERDARGDVQLDILVGACASGTGVIGRDSVYILSLVIGTSSPPEIGATLGTTGTTAPGDTETSTATIRKIVGILFLLLAAAAIAGYLLLSKKRVK